ncbi:MAG TPA: c-type cytochrome [Kofleriaceae bacterium]|nr:c-type cytochrome [Kofleriaceae bacterium]
MTRLILPLPLLALLIVAACRPSNDRAELGAPAAVDVPVGPVPGPSASSQGSRNPYGQDPAVLAEGRKLFVHFNCHGCHGDHGGGGMGPSLRDTDWLYGDSEARIFDSIAEGRGRGMPAWGGMLTEDQIWKLEAYIRSLRTRAEPEPPH